MMELLKLTNICKAWPDGQAQMLPVLEGLDLTLDKGEFIAVTGVSGSGKTTLLQILGTLVPPDAGSYRFDGTELTAPDVDLDAFRNRRLGFVFQDHRLLPYLSVRENILLPALAGQDAASGEQAARARELMDLANDGDPKAKLVLHKVNYDVIKLIGQYAAAMNGVDLICFAGGIGEHNGRFRRRVLENFSYLGLKVDYEANNAAWEANTIISAPDSAVKAALICTNEELVIARDTMHLVQGK